MTRDGKHFGSKVPIYSKLMPIKAHLDYILLDLEVP